MKKALIVLLILAIAGGLFAQEVVWTGSVRTGVWVQGGDGHDDLDVLADDDDSDSAVKAKLGAAYDADNWGLQIGTEAAGASRGPGTFSFYDAHGWIKFIDGLIVVRAGQIDPGIWSTGGWVDQGFAAGLGVRVEAYPIPGLSLGAKFGYPEGTGYSAAKIGYFFQETAIGFAFDADLFNVSAAMKLYSEETTGDKTDLSFTFGAGTNVAGLSVYVGAAFYNVLISDDIKMRFGLDLGYTVGKLGIGLVVGIGINDIGEEAYVTETGFDFLKVVPSVSFPVTDNIEVGAEVPFIMADNGDGLGFAEISPKAYLKYTTGNAWIQGSYNLKMITKDYGDTTNHNIRFVFGYSF